MRFGRRLALLTAAALIACGATQTAQPVVDGGAPGSGASDAATAGDAISASDAGSEGDGGHAGCALTPDPALGSSKWAAIDPSGNLTYAALPTGETLLDFSYAGYRGGGVAIPILPVAKTVTPSGGDDTAAIQAAIDAVSKMPLASGVRGAVLLAPGAFTINGSLTIAASGVVLRGSGSGAGGTQITVTGAPRTVFTIAGTGAWKAAGASAKITDGYVPSGARTFQVDDASALHPGMAVLVERPVTDAWIHFMGMDTLVRDGGAQTWLSNTTVIHSDRVVVAVNGNAVTVDAPLSDSLDAKYLGPKGATVVPYSFDGRIAEVGLEAMHVVAPKQTAPIDAPTFTVLSMDAAIDGWVKDVVTDEFTFGFVLADGAKWITIEDSSVARTAPIDNGAGYPFQYSVAGQQTLVQRCRAAGDDVFSYATQARAPGPNVVLGLTVTGARNRFQPHQRWATGLLADGVQSPAEEIDLMNRGTAGSGHGWAIGFGVAWNGVGASLLVQRPPGSMNWAIGSSGKEDTAPMPGDPTNTPLPNGIFDSPGKPVAPKSLYLAQLCLRLGPTALKNVGY